MKITSLLSILVFCFAFPLFSQNSTELLIKPSTVFKVEKAVSFENFFAEYSDAMKLSEGSVMIANPPSKSRHAANHRKYKQSYKGLEVYGMAYTLHGKNGIVDHATGTFTPGINVDTEAAIDNEDIVHKNAIKSVLMSYRNDKKLNFKKTTEKYNDHNTVAETKSLVIIDHYYPAITKEQVLAYKVIVKSTNEALKYEVLVSAVDGTVIFKRNLILHGDANGTGKTFYYGDQKIITDSIGPNKFVLRDNTRGDGITTYKMENDREILTIEDSDNVWDDAEVNALVAIDAHFCTEKFYDMMNDNFDYSGLDGQGKSMNPVVHYAGLDNFLNAFWDGDKAYFGHGDCHHGPLTTLSVVGHEFTHGITQYNSNLIYDKESGAINESFSDIFGKALEILVDTAGYTWELGPEFALSDFSMDFRSFTDPHKHQHPKKYKGKYWEDNNGVHTNSSVLNHWFYLLVEGVSGTSEGVTYNVPKVDMMDVLDIVFLCQTSYMTESSGYVEMYKSTLLACKSLFGENSTQYNAIIEAWKAVGIDDTLIGSSDEIIDLAMTAPQEIIYCIENDFLDLGVMLVNVGSLPVPINSIVKFKRANETTYNYTLTEELKVGESIEVTIPNYLYLNSDEYFFEIIDFTSTVDENPSNNTAFFTGENFTIPEPNFALQFIYQETSECFTPQYKVSPFIQNSSCVTIPSGTELEIKFIHSGTTLSSHMIVLPNDLLPGEYYSQAFDIPKSSNFFLGYEVLLSSNIDNYVDDDLTYFIPDKVGEITSSYKETFDVNDTDELDFGLIGKFYVERFENEKYLITQGGYVDAVPCLDIERNLGGNSYSGVNFFSICLDVNAFENPKLTFDLIQFRSGIFSTFGLDSLNYLSSVLKVEYINDKEPFKKLIYGQEEGELVNHSFNLPKESIGELIFTFYNSKADNSYFNINYIEDIDAMFFDNLIIENSTSTDITEEHNTKIFPNPAMTHIRIESEADVLHNFIVTNTQGQVVLKADKVLSGQSTDINALPSGHYMVRFIASDKPVVMPFVKI